MFNQYLYNQTAYNQQTIFIEYLSSVMEAEGGFALDTSMILDARLTIDGVGTAEIDLARISFTNPAEWEGQAGGQFVLGKLFTSGANWQGIGTITINNDAFNIFVMEYTGQLDVGETLTLNTERFTLVKDGQNVLNLLEGDFVNLKLGLNEIQIESDTVTRTLLVRVEHRDRWL